MFLVLKFLSYKKRIFFNFSSIYVVVSTKQLVTLISLCLTMENPLRSHFMLQLYPLVWFVVVCNFLVFFCFAVLFDLTFCSNLFIANLSAYLLPVLLLKIVVRQFFFFFVGGRSNSCRKRGELMLLQFGFIDLTQS